MPTLQCLSRDALKEYLSGWTDAEQSDAIESHLVQCDDCEQTIISLERDPETLIEFVRNSHNQTSVASNPVPDSAIAYALSRAKRLSSASDEPTAAWQPPASDFGPYELLRPLGYGGMASVYLARHRQLSKQVAIKLLPSRPFRNDHYAARFQREIRTAGQLNHPAIVSATDAGEHDGTHYLVMEYIDGLDLSRVARLNGPLPIADACAIMRTVAIGLSHAHAEGIVHRDIKPSNLMLSLAGEVKVLDFGLAQVSLWDEASAELTTVGQLMGTLDYMAPEQAERPEAVDYRADLYSLGATLFRLLCGRAPLAAAPDLSPLVKLRLLASHQPPRLDTLRTDAPEKLVEFVGQLLARNPADRPASAAHVAEQLAQFTGAADLKSLIATAQSKSHDDPANVSLLTHAPAVHSRPALSGIGRRITRWLLAASLLPLFIIAGVLITLETQKGQLVIESEGANVEVKLLRDGEFYEKLKITPGVNTTRLYAGKYQVIIDAGSDTFTIDQQQIAIVRGNAVVARVRSIANTLIAGGSTESSALPPASTGQLYEGKPLAFWLDKFERERSQEELGKALSAMYALASETESAKQIEAVLLKWLPRLGELLNTNQWTLLDTLLKCQPTDRRFFELLASELEKSDSKSDDRIIEGVYSEMLQQRFRNLDDFEPIRRWIISKVFQSDERSHLLEVSTQVFLSAQHLPYVNDEQKQVLIDDLLACKKLGLDFWLRVFPIKSSSLPSPWTPQYATTVESKAVEALRSSETDSRHVVQAMIIIEVVHSKEYKNHSLTPSISLEEVLKAIEVQVARASNDDKFLLEIVPIGRDASVRRIEPFGSLTSLAPASYTISKSSPNTTNLGLELLQLVRTLQVEKESSALIGRILDATRAEAFRFANSISNPYSPIRSKITNITLDWPSFQCKVNDVRPSQSQLVSYLIFDCAFGMLPATDQKRLEPEHRKRLKLEYIDANVKECDTDGDGKLSYAESVWPSAADIDTDHDQFLSIPELFVEFEKPLKKEPELPQPQLPQPQPQPNVPESIYEGKPLSEWLELFVRERSPSGTGAALEAMAALVSESTAKKYVETTLLESLPTLGNRQITYERSESVWLDRVAFPVLASCFATRKEYFEMLAKQLEAADEEWARRILSSAVQSVGWDPDEVEPTVAWIDSNILQSETRSGLALDAANLFVSIVNRGSNQPVEFKRRLLKSVSNCQKIGFEFWIGRPPEITTSWNRQNPLHSRWDGAYASAIESKAIEAIISDKTSDALVAQAAIVLNILNSPEYDRTGMEANQQSPILVFAIARRLKAAAQNLEKLCGIQQIDLAFKIDPDPRRSNRVKSASIRSSNESYQPSFYESTESVAVANVAIELLNLATQLQLRSNFESELLAIIDLTKELTRKVAMETTGFKVVTFRLLHLDDPISQPATITSKECLSYVLFEKSRRLLKVPKQLEVDTSEATIRLDKDLDGLLSYEEAGKAVPRPEVLDSNTDKYISKEELLAYIANPEKYPPKLGTRFDDWAYYVIARYDTNCDGQLTASEWNGMAIKPEGADRNKNGVIEVDECEKFYIRES